MYTVELDNMQNALNVIVQYIKTIKKQVKREKSTSSIVLLKLNNNVKFTISAGKKFQLLTIRSVTKDCLTLFGF